LSNFGDEWFLEPLARLVDSANDEGGLLSADVEPVAYLSTCLEDRLKLVHHLERHPKIREETVETAGVIVGLGRGGSTLLHRLLAKSSALNSPYAWEMITPVPLSDEEPGNASARKEQGRLFSEAWYQSLPAEFKTVHSINAAAVEEEMPLLDRAFASMLWACHFNAPSYLQWLTTYNHMKVYEELRVWLQLLQYQAPDRRGRKWLLKAPHHLLYGGMDTLGRVFPDALLIVTHRDMRSVIPSICDAQAMIIERNAPNFRRATLGPRLVLHYESALRKMMSIRKQGMENRFIDVAYETLLADPIGQFRRVLAAMGLPASAEDILAAKYWMDHDGARNTAKHLYKMEDFGLEATAIGNLFRFYHQAYLGQ
jgi:hypothetical protein